MVGKGQETQFLPENILLQKGAKNNSPLCFLEIGICTHTNLRRPVRVGWGRHGRVFSMAVPDCGMLCPRTFGQASSLAASLAWSKFFYQWVFQLVCLLLYTQTLYPNAAQSSARMWLLSAFIMTHGSGSQSLRGRFRHCTGLQRRG